MVALSNSHYVFIVVSAMNAVASLQRIGRVWLVFQQPRESLQHRQGEILMLKHKTLFLLVTSGQILVSIGTTATFLVLALLIGGHWTVIFLMSTVTSSIAGQCAWMAGQWDSQRNGGHLFLMLVGLDSISTVFTYGVYLADKDRLLGVILYCLSFAFFRFWMIFEWIKSFKIIQRSLPLPYSPQTKKELFKLKGCCWIEAGFALVIPIAYILATYYINLWNIDLIHPGMLVVTALAASFHDLCADGWLLVVQLGPRLKAIIFRFGSWILLGLESRQSQIDEDVIELTQCEG